jgi:hypothetical protein
MEDMKVKNYHVRGDAATVKRLKEEYEYIGRWVKLLDPNHLVVLAYPPKKDVKKKSEDDKRRSHRAPRQDRG